MKKKYVLGLLVIISLFMVTACGNKEKLDEDIQDNHSEEENIEEEYADLELYSDDTKIVFARGQEKVVFFYKGNSIIGEHAYFDYQTNSLANIALKFLNSSENENIAKAYVNGKYLVIEYNENEYGSLTLEDVKLTYSYLEEVKKSN